MIFIIPLRHFRVPDVRSVEGQFHVNMTVNWEPIPGELNGNVLKFLSAKELAGFKIVCKNAKSAAESEKGLLFDAIRVRLDKIIDEHGFESVPNTFNFKVKNHMRFLGFPRVVSYIVNITKRCVQFILDEDIFKVGVNIESFGNMGTVHACPYIREVTRDLGVSGWIHVRVMFFPNHSSMEPEARTKSDAPKLTKELKVHLKGDDNRGEGVGGKRRHPD